MKLTCKLLVVEDDAIIAEDIRLSIECAGHELLGILSSGEKALQFIETRRPDFVLMDIVLRGQLNGIETAIKLHHEHNIPVIFLTAYTDPATMKRTEQAHPYGHVSKPFYKQKLNRVLEKAIRQRAQEKSNAGADQEETP